jgi:hypothetical protein
MWESTRCSAEKGADPIKNIRRKLVDENQGQGSDPARRMVRGDDLENRIVDEAVAGKEAGLRKS